MALSPEVIEDILYQYKRTRSPYKVAREVGVDASVVWQVINDHADKLSPIQERFGGYGRPEMQQFLVARRMSATREWDNTELTIALARRRYELGTHDMMQGRDGRWLLLYSKPNKVVRPRLNYFRPEAYT